MALWLGCQSSRRLNSHPINNPPMTTQTHDCQVLKLQPNMARVAPHMMLNIACLRVVKQKCPAILSDAGRGVALAGGWRYVVTLIL